MRYVTTDGTQCLSILLLCVHGHGCLFYCPRLRLLVVGHHRCVLPSKVSKFLIFVALECRWWHIFLVFKVCARRNLPILLAGTWYPLRKRLLQHLLWLTLLVAWPPRSRFYGGLNIRRLSAWLSRLLMSFHTGLSASRELATSLP